MIDSISLAFQEVFLRFAGLYAGCYLIISYFLVGFHPKCTLHQGLFKVKTRNTHPPQPPYREGGFKNEETGARDAKQASHPFLRRVFAADGARKKL